MMGDVAVVALVNSLEAQQVSCCCHRSCRSLTLPPHGRQVIRARECCAFPQVKTINGAVMLKDAAH